MKTRNRPWLRRAAFALACLSALWAVVIVVPWPRFALFPLWQVRLAALETSLVGAACGVAALVLAPWAGRVPPWAIVVALAGTVVTSAPAVLSVSPYRTAGARFSPTEYLRGAEAPDVEERHDVTLPGAPPGLESDLYLPEGAGPHPLVVVVHGGSWRGGDKGTARAMSRLLAGRGFLVVDVRYRLAPAAIFPAAVADVKCLAGLVCARAELRADPSRIALLGRSAGGQIALMAAYTSGDPTLPPSCAVEDRPVVAVAAVYAPTDMAWGYDNPMRPDVVDGTASLAAYLGGSPRTHPEVFRRASPQSWTGRPLPRTLLVHGTSDRLVSIEHLRSLRQALQVAGHPVRTLEVPLADHGFDVRSGGLGEQLSRRVIFDFLDGR